VIINFDEKIALVTSCITELQEHEQVFISFEAYSKFELCKSITEFNPIYFHI